MGQSTDAILFYGYCWTGEGIKLLGESDGEEDDPEWQEVILTRRGYVNPWSLLPDKNALLALGAAASTADLEVFKTKRYYTGMKNDDYIFEQFGGDLWVAQHREEINAWSAAKAEVAIEYGCNIASHCSCEYPMPYIHVVAGGTHTVASRGYPQKITVSQMMGATTYDEELTRFISDLGISLESDDYTKVEGPGWFLVSEWC